MRVTCGSVHLVFCPLSAVTSAGYEGGMTTKCLAARRGEWCGLCYSGKKGRGTFPGHYGWVKPSVAGRIRCMLLKKRVVSADSSNGSAVFSGTCKLGTSYPALLEFITSTSWDGGASRVPGTVTLLMDGGMLKAALNDRDSGTSCFVAGQSFTDLLKAVESVLIEGKGDWRVKQTPFKGGPRKSS